MDARGQTGSEQFARERFRDGPFGDRRQHEQMRLRCGARQGVSMRFIVMLIVLIFPVLDVLATVRFARWTGIPTVAWLLASAIAGSLLLRHEIVTFREKNLAALRGDQPLLRGLLDSGRKVLAALLLILPGIVSDLIALTLLSLPFTLGVPLATQAACMSRRVLHRDYRRID